MAMLFCQDSVTKCQIVDTKRASTPSGLVPHSSTTHSIALLFLLKLEMSITTFPHNLDAIQAPQITIEYQAWEEQVLLIIENEGRQSGAPVERPPFGFSDTRRAMVEELYINRGCTLNEVIAWFQERFSDVPRYVAPIH